MDTTKRGFSDKAFFKPNIKSDLIKKMMNDSAISLTDMADYLNCTVSSLRNKFSRDSFSLYDFIIICDVCKYSLTIQEADTEWKIETAKDRVQNAFYNFKYLDDDILDKIGLDRIDLEKFKESVIDIEIAQENLEGYECFFDFEPSNILTQEEVERIEQIKKAKRKEKYHRIVNKLSTDEQKTLLEYLQENINDSED